MVSLVAAGSTRYRLLTILSHRGVSYRWVGNDTSITHNSQAGESRSLEPSAANVPTASGTKLEKRAKERYTHHRASPQLHPSFTLDPLSRSMTPVSALALPP